MDGWTTNLSWQGSAVFWPDPDRLPLPLASTRYPKRVPLSVLLPHLPFLWVLPTPGEKLWLSSRTHITFWAPHLYLIHRYTSLPFLSSCLNEEVTYNFHNTYLMLWIPACTMTPLLKCIFFFLYPYFSVHLYSFSLLLSFNHLKKLCSLLSLKVNIPWSYVFPLSIVILFVCFPWTRFLTLAYNDTASFSPPFTPKLTSICLLPIPRHLNCPLQGHQWPLSC